MRIKIMHEKNVCFVDIMSLECDFFKRNKLEGRASKACQRHARKARL